MKNITPTTSEVSKKDNSSDPLQWIDKNKKTPNELDLKNVQKDREPITRKECFPPLIRKKCPPVDFYPLFDPGLSFFFFFFLIA